MSPGSPGSASRATCRRCGRRTNLSWTSSPCRLSAPELAARQYVFADLLRSGARLAAGSDWAVSSASPLRAIHVAVNRSLYGARAEPLLPGQALELAEAMAAYTIGSAFVNHLDDVTGSIEPGKLADLVVLDRDPFTLPPDEIAATSVLATYVEGAAVYRHPAFS